MTDGERLFYALSERIEHLRELTVAAGLKYGLASPETLRHSEELDKLIVQIQRMDR